MIDRSDETGQPDQTEQQQGQRDYADQPTYRQQSQQTPPDPSGASAEPGYREQDYGGERMYQPDPNEQQPAGGDQG